MYVEDLALNNLQCLICHKNKPNQTKKNDRFYAGVPKKNVPVLPVILTG